MAITSRDHLTSVLRELIREQSEGEWDDAMIRKDAQKFADTLWPLIDPTPTTPGRD